MIPKGNKTTMMMALIFEAMAIPNAMANNA